MEGKPMASGNLTARSGIEESNGLYDSTEGKRSFNDALLVFKSIVKLSMRDVPQKTNQMNPFAMRTKIIGL
jgi:hypothetical protein